MTGTASTLAQSAGDIEVKVRPVARGYYHLREAMDLELQRKLRRSVRELGLEDAIEDKQLSVALVDVTEPGDPRLAMINGDEMMYAASLPKIAILFGAFQKIHEGRLRLDDELRQQMIDMIRVSSNEAATYVLDRVGRSYLARLLQSRQYRFYDASLNGGLWVGKAYASGGAYQRDPLHNISHGATAYQVARFYYLMETGRLVSPEYSRQMKEIMGNPGIHHKFVKGLEESHPDARIYRKSGTWREFHSDSAIVERAGRRYIAVALAEHRKGGEWLQKLIVAMDDIVFSQPRPIQSAGLN
ncbi:MAG TPA: serine hydrolase [Nevskiales bacterium]|nr:serine hydrolase [Nevskiales bacterium]